jgi:hypothetical protein
MDICFVYGKGFFEFLESAIIVLLLQEAAAQPMNNATNIWMVLPND